MVTPITVRPITLEMENKLDTLQVHRCEDSKYDINWVVANNREAMVDRQYVERHEPTYSGFSLIVTSPDDPEWLMEYACNEEGFMSVSDFKHRGRVFEVMPMGMAIQELIDNTNRVLSADKT